MPACFLRPTLLALVASFALPFAPALHAQRAPVEAEHGMVTSAHELASRAGLEMLERGGNAVDAAVATGLALTSVYPRAGNLGGGGFMMIHLADVAGDGRGPRDVAIDYRETAPAASTRDMYLGPDGNVLEGPGSSVLGWRASGVPGTVAGLALAFEKYGSGKLTWADVCEPARRLASGHILSQGAAADLKQHAKLLSQFDESKKIYLKDGALWKAGELWRQPDLAATFARLAKDGPREFYEGETAKRIADAMAKNHGTISLADLKAYRAVERTPLRGTYRSHEIVTMPPPSSGGIALLQMLAMLEPIDLAALGASSAAKYHVFIEVMRRAYRDRAEYLGDPDFTQVPVRELLDRDYLKRRMSTFDPRRATPSDQVEPGLGPAKLTQSFRTGAAPFAAESTETTHFSVVDAAGNAVANTYTLNALFGSGVTIPGTGILLNDEMDDFNARAGVKDRTGAVPTAANLIAPGKRPRSSMTPTFVFKEGKLVLLTGSPGGSTIINTVLQVITNVIDHGMSVTQAVEAPRIHHQWMPDVLSYEPLGLSPDTITLLTTMGHTVKLRRPDEGNYQGGAESIAIDPKTNLRLGAADLRKPDAKAVGY